MTLEWLPNDDTPLLDAAIAYASQGGFRVLSVWWLKANGRCACGRPECVPGPKSSAGKHPIGAAWQKHATKDVDAVRDARNARPHANIGLAMGGPERLVAIDIDGEAGRASWAEIEANVMPAPVTLTSASGREDGGEHRIYRVPPHLDIKRLGNRAGAVWPGIDTRTDNGQIVVAPSVHQSGARYRWTVREPIAELPEWLFDVLATPLPVAPTKAKPLPPATTSTPASSVHAYVAKVVENAARDIAAQREGGRNQILFAKSCTVFEYHLGEGLDHLGAWNALADAGIACGLPAPEVSAVLSKAWRKAQSGERRRVPPPNAPTSAPLVPATTTTTTRAEAAPAEVIPAATFVDALDTAWEKSLTTNAKNGEVKNTFGNLAKILRCAPEFAGRLSYNEMRITPCLDGVPLKDSDIGAIRERIEDRWGLSPSKDAATDAIALVSSSRSFHPVRAYLEGLAWDGQSRVDRVAEEILGVNIATQPLAVRMLRIFFVSAAARALMPGCKVDTSLVLRSEDQGKRKSTFFSVLGGEWFSDSYADVRSKDGVLQVHNAWLYEWAEIDRITTKRDAADVKAFITIARDDVRPPYGRGIVNQPRSGVIVGTTNKPFLDDDTGSRRFHPIEVTKIIDVSLLREWRDQLWAEAVASLRSGYEWWLTEAEERTRELSAASHAIEDGWTERIALYLEAPGRRDNGVTTADVLMQSVGIPLDRITRDYETRAGKALRMLGWAPRQTRRGGAVVRVYMPRAVVTDATT